MKNYGVASAHAAHCRKRNNKKQRLVHVAPAVIRAAHERAGFDVAEAECLRGVGFELVKFISGHLTLNSILVLPSDKPKASPPGAASDIGNLVKIIGDNAIDAPPTRYGAVRGLRHRDHNVGLVRRSLAEALIPRA
jgi:hypothetical protein